MYAVSICLVTLCGLALSAPNDVHFDFATSEVVRSDGVSSGGQPGQVGHVVPVHKFHEQKRRAAQGFFDSASGQALDQAGGQFFSALGNLATRTSGGPVGGQQGGQVRSAPVSGGQAVAHASSGQFSSQGGEVSGQTRFVSSDTPTQTSHVGSVTVHKNPAHRQAAQDFYNSGSGQALDQAGAQFFTSLGDFLSSILGGGRRNQY